MLRIFIALVVVVDLLLAAATAGYAPTIVRQLLAAEAATAAADPFQGDQP